MATPLTSRHFARYELSSASASPDAAGGYTLTDVTLLAAGTWSDSVSNRAITYTPDNLAKFSILRSTGYRIHSLSKRGYADEIGEIKNTRYDAAKQAIVTDVYLHCLTQASRDTLAMIKRREELGDKNYVSVEVAAIEHPIGNETIAEEITITGWIVTNRPACTACEIPPQTIAAGLETTTEESEKMPDDQPVVAVEAPKEESDSRDRLNELQNIVSAQAEKLDRILAILEKAATETPTQATPDADGAPQLETIPKPAAALEASLTAAPESRILIGGAPIRKTAAMYNYVGGKHY